MSKQYYVYIMTNKNNRVLYTGITSDLKKRVYEHKEKFVDGFTPLEIMPRCSAAGLDFRIIPVGFNAPLEFLTGFTKKYNVSKLVYYEIFGDPENAILREKQIKAGSRQKKIDLIETINKKWNELYGNL